MTLPSPRLSIQELSDRALCAAALLVELRAMLPARYQLVLRGGMPILSGMIEATIRAEGELPIRIVLAIEDYPTELSSAPARTVRVLPKALERLREHLPSQP